MSKPHPIMKRHSHNDWRATTVSDIIAKSTAVIELIPNGSDTSRFIHKELLCSFSPYYAAALQGGFLEARKAELSVDLRKETLEIFVTWIYTGKIPHECSASQLIALYIYADQTDILALRRSIMSTFCELRPNVTKDVGTNLWYCLVGDAFEDLPDNSPLRQWLVDNHVWNHNHSFDIDPRYENLGTDHHEKAPVAFFWQVILGLSELTKFAEPMRFLDARSRYNPATKACIYHEHKSPEEWRATCGASGIRIPIYSRDSLFKNQQMESGSGPPNPRSAGQSWW